MAESVAAAINGVIVVQRSVRIRIRYRRCKKDRLDVAVTACDSGVEYNDGGGGVRSIIMVVVIVVRI